MFADIETGKTDLEVEEPSKGPFELLAGILKTLLFRVFLQHQPPLKKSKVKSTLKTRLQLCFVVIQGLQVLSIIVEYTTQVTYYDSFRFIGDALQGVRPDLWAENSNQVQTAVIISLLYLLGVLSVFGSEMALEYLYPERTIHPLIKAAFDVPDAFIHRFALVPLLLLFMKSVLNSLISPDGSQYDALWMGLLCLLGLFICGTLATLRICFLYECAWAHRQHRMLARSNCSYELKEVATYFIICGMSAAKKAPATSLLVTFGLSFYLTFQMTVFLPYYHQLTVLAKTIQHGLTAWSCIAAEVAVASDSMTAGVCLFLFIGPCAGLLLIHLLHWRNGRIRFSKEAQPFWMYELALRRLLVKHESEPDTYGEQLMDCLNYGSKRFDMQKEFYLHLAHYYYHQRELPEIALLRLSMSTRAPGSMLVNFQIVKFSRVLSKLSKSEEREFVDYQSSFMQAKDLDRKMCEKTYEVLNVLLCKSTNSSQLELSFFALATMIREAEESYRGLRQKFPNDPFVLEAYGTFVGDLFHDTASQDLITRAFFERNRRLKTNINTIETYSSEDTGVMVISCSPTSFGKITFANDQLGRILSCKALDIIGKDLDDFIPPPYTYGHNRNLAHFLAVGEGKEVFRKNLFLSSMGRFSVEVTFRFRPTAVNNVPFFVTAVRPKPSNREFVLYNGETYIITSHSIGFPEILQINAHKRNLNGQSLEMLMPGIRELSDKTGTDPFCYRHPETSVTYGAMFSQVDLGHFMIRWLYVFTQVKGIEDILTTTTGEAVNLLRRQMHSTSMSSEKVVMTTEATNHTGFQTEVEGKEPKLPLGLKDTKESGGTGTTNSLSNFASSSTGLALRKHALESVKTYKVSYLVAVFLMAILLSICLAVVYTTFRSLSQSNNVIDLGSSRFHLVKITHLVRRLNLIHAGMVSTAHQTTLVNDLNAEIVNLGHIIDSNFKQKTELVPIWTLIKDKYQLLSSPMINSLMDFNAHAQFQANGGAADSTDFFYVYSNGMTSLLHTLNATVNQSLDDMKSSGFTQIAVATGVSFLLMGIVLAVSYVFMIKSLFQLRSCYRVIWATIAKLPIASLRMIMNAHKERIELVHGWEISVMELTRIKENKALYLPPNKCVFIVLKVLVFALGTTAFIMFTLLYGYSEVQTLLNSQSDYLNTRSQNMYLPILALHLLQESYLQNTNQSYFSIVAQGQQFYSLSSDLDKVLMVMDYFENKALSDSSSLLAQGGSGEIDAIINTVCQSVNVSSLCESSALAMGQHQGMIEMRLMLLDYNLRVTRGEINWTDLTQLEAYLDLLTEATQVTLDDMQNYTGDLSQTFVNSMLMYSCIYLFAAIGLFIVLYLPMINHLKRECLSAWRISTLIRNDYIVSK